MIHNSRVEIIIDRIELSPITARKHINFIAELDDLKDDQKLKELISKTLKNKGKQIDLDFGVKSRDLRKIEIFIDKNLALYKCEKLIGFSTVIKDIDDYESLERVISSALSITSAETVKDKDIF